MNFKDLGNMTKPEIDKTIAFLIEAKKAGQFRAFWKTFDESVNLMASGEVIIQSMWSPAVAAVRSKGIPCNYQPLAEGYRAWAGGLGIAKHLSGLELDAAYEYINWYLSGWVGAYLNRQRIQVSKIANLSECLVATGFPSHKRHKNPNIHFYHQITLRTHGVRRAGSAALDLCCVASGRFDAFWEFNLNPWDTAAGVLIVKEAGGKVTDFKGGPFQLNSRETLASNALLHPALLHEFAQIFEGRGLEPLPAIQEYRK